jgi:hypothetical protein
VGNRSNEGTRIWSYFVLKRPPNFPKNMIEREY